MQEVKRKHLRVIVAAVKLVVDGIGRTMRTRQVIAENGGDLPRARLPLDDAQAAEHQDEHQDGGRDLDDTDREVDDAFGSETIPPFQTCPVV
jgi:hypothetical protein